MTKRRKPRAGGKDAGASAASSPLARALGALAGLLASLLLLAGALVYATTAGWLPAPAFLAAAPEGLALAPAAPAAGARASAEAKVRAFAVARREKAAITLSLSAAELHALLERSRVGADAVRIDPSGLWVSGVSPLGRLPLRRTALLSPTAAGTLAALEPAARYLGTLPLPALPAWAGGSLLDAPARDALAGLERALGVPAASLAVAPGDGELTLRTL